MQSTDVRDELADGFESAALPPRAPDGTLAPFSASKGLDEPPPRLCEYGPCRHYHRFDVQVDAENPKSERIAGRLVVHAKVFHTSVHHYCYPDVGIETVLGAMPVLGCNRWVPVGGLLRRLTGSVGRAHRAHRSDLDAWHARREAEVRELAEAAGLLEPPREMLVTFERAGAESLHVGQEADSETTLEALVQLALRHTPLQLAQLDGHALSIDGAPVNPAATLGELDLAAGTRILVTLSHTPPKDRP